MATTKITSQVLAELWAAGTAPAWVSQVFAEAWILPAAPALTVSQVFVEAWISSTAAAPTWRRHRIAAQVT